MEQLSCGVPSVVHPKIYFPGINYETGIITNKNISDFSDAIIEIMENKVLYNHLSSGAINFAKNKFSKDLLMSSYKNILDSVNVG